MGNKICFLHFIVELTKPKLTMALEDVLIYKDYLLVNIRYLFDREIHLLKLNNRFVHGIAIKKNNIYRYKGFVPYWINSFSQKIPIYNSLFNRIFKVVYYLFSDNIKGFFIFNKNGYEFLCIRYFESEQTRNFKFIIRIF